MKTASREAYFRVKALGHHSRDLLIMFLSRKQGSWGELASRLPRAT